MLKRSSANMALEIPAAVVKPLTLNRLYLGTIVGMHLLGLLALHPYFFSWAVGSPRFWTRYHDWLPPTSDPPKFQNPSLG